MMMDCPVCKLPEVVVVVVGQFGSLLVVGSIVEVVGDFVGTEVVGFDSFVGSLLTLNY
jgi:hypothetical protein